VEAQFPYALIPRSARARPRTILQLARRGGMVAKGRTREIGETGELPVLAELYRREVLGG
jgi:hypothetical protein